MRTGILGKKIDQLQNFLEDGTRVPITRIWAGENYVVWALPNRIQLGFHTSKKVKKPIRGILKKAGIEKNLRFFREVKSADGQETRPGAAVVVGEIFKPGDLVQVMGVSKGKGFAGVVKRHHFRGGPRTHGQSDRERAPGSIGQTTTPGRVYKGKRMAARMGGERVTVKNLVVLDVSGDIVTIKGLVPGGRNSLLIVTKTGEAKKFVPLYREQTEGNEKTATTEIQNEPEAQNVSISENLSGSVVAREVKDAS